LELDSGGGRNHIEVSEVSKKGITLCVIGHLDYIQILKSDLCIQTNVLMKN